MDESLLSEFEQLKISAFTKYKFLNCDSGQVTLGPKSLQKKIPKQPLETGSKKDDFPLKIEQSSNNNEVQILLKNNETQRIKDVRKSIQNHIENMENFSKQNSIYHHKKWLDAQSDFIKDQREREMKILEANDEYDRTKSVEHAKVEKQHKDLEQQRKLREQELKDAEERRKILHLNIDRITKSHQEFFKVYKAITLNIQKCVNKEKLKEKFGNNNDQLRNLLHQMEEIRLKCANNTVTEIEVKKCIEILTNIQKINNKLKEIVEEINAQKEEVPQKAVPPTEPVSVPASNQQISQESAVANKVQSTINNQSQSTKTEETMSKYVSVTNFKFYCEVISFLGNHIRSFDELEHNVSLKQFRFDCKKAVNIPVNALSGVSSEHILDKYNRLFNLLKGQNVEVNDKIVNASKHPQGIAFCMDLLAKKLVLQGDLMVSSNPESAFCYASLIISIWNEIPPFGDIILAYFYMACPPLVPYYMPREVGETDEQFYKKCGYQYVDGQIETQDKFLKRMTGIARLYFAILVAKPKRGQNKTPHNLTHGWRWLSSILNMEPQVDTTATMLHTFLETVGFEMQTRYGKMFLKLLQIIRGKFLRACKEKCTGGAGTRLELLLDQYMEKRQFSQPPGYTSMSSW